jgi:hypothetical protein
MNVARCRHYSIVPKVHNDGEKDRIEQEASQAFPLSLSPFIPKKPAEADFIEHVMRDVVCHVKEISFVIYCSTGTKTTSAK